MAAVLAESPADLPDTVVLDNTTALLHLRRQLDGAVSTNLQVIDRRQVTAAECARSTRGWLVEEQLLSPGEAV